MRRLALALSIASSVFVPAASVTAGDVIIAEAEDEETTETASDGPYITACDFRDLVYSRNGRYEEGPFLMLYIDASWFRFNPATGEAWIRSWEWCDWSDGTTTSDSIWRPLNDPDPEIAIDPAYDRVVKTVDAPVPDLSPAGPGFVNLGMWLATSEPAVNPVVARAAAGNNWAEVTGRLTTTTFDFGNGDSVTCDGFGEPIPDSALDSLDEGPCGYTYDNVSGDTPFTVTVTAVWTVTYVLSDGRTGSRPDIVLSASVPYEVLEIQTVGTRN